MNFDEFIERETARDTGERARLQEEQRQRWLARVDELYGMIKDIMSDYVEAGKVTITTEHEVELYEELLGSYKARQMEIKLGNLGKFVTLTPVGTYVIGAWGRVDMSGPNGTIRLVLVNAHLKAPRISVTIRNTPAFSQPEAPQPMPDLAWRLATMPPKIEYLPINKATFFEALMNLFSYE